MQTNEIQLNFEEKKYRDYNNSSRILCSIDENWNALYVLFFNFQVDSINKVQ